MLGLQEAADTVEVFTLPWDASLSHPVAPNLAIHEELYCSSRQELAAAVDLVVSTMCLRVIELGGDSLVALEVEFDLDPPYRITARGVPYVSLRKAKEKEA